MYTILISRKDFVQAQSGWFPSAIIYSSLKNLSAWYRILESF